MDVRVAVANWSVEFANTLGQQLFRDRRFQSPKQQELRRLTLWRGIIIAVILNFRGRQPKRADRSRFYQHKSVIP